MAETVAIKRSVIITCKNTLVNHGFDEATAEEVIRNEVYRDTNLMMTWNLE